jgi:hypothetical protein
MNINMSTMSFKSRSADIKTAEKICHEVVGKFPVISPSRVITESIHKQNRKMFNYGNNLEKKFENLVREPLGNLDISTNPIDYLELLIAKVKENKLANCHELAKLALLISIVNGFEARIYELTRVNQNPKRKRGLNKEIDHAVLALSNDISFGFRHNDTIIIDPWFNFVGPAKKAMAFYKNSVFPNAEMIKGDVLFALPYPGRIPKKFFEDLKKAFPEFIIENT